jgi:hypothetical protein
MKNVEPDVVLNDFNEKSAAIEELAITTAKALSNTEFRNHIKNEAMKQFDGDYDILYSRLNNEALKNGAVNGNFYLDNLSLVQSAFKTNPKEYISNLIKQVPKFQIAVPVNCENWNADNYTPLVAYIPVNFDEKTFTKIKAFDSKGNIHWLPLDKDPDFPVIVLGYNERTDDEGNLLDSNNSFKNYPIDDGGGGGGGGGSSATSRTNGHAEYINKFKFTDLSNYEPWCLGKPEIRLHVYSSTKIQLRSLFWHLRRNVVDGHWKTVNREIFDWYWNDYGNFLLMEWIEEDGGIISSIPITFSALGIASVTINVPVSSNDDNIGNSVVNKVDSKQKVYHNDDKDFFWYETF